MNPSKRLEKGTRKKGPVAVVEEVADNIYSVKFILQSLGFAVRSFSCREEYLPELSEYAPRLVLVDMMIPAGGAFEVIREVRRTLGKSVPIVAITAQAMEGGEADVYEAGAQDVLSKPYGVTDLQDVIGKWLT